MTSAMYLITPPFPPQVQVRPVTPVTSICQVSWSRLCIWHDLVFFLALILFFFFFFFLPSLVFPSSSNPSGVNAMSSQEAEFEMTAWKHVITQSRTSTSGLTFRMFFHLFFFWGCLFVSVSYCHANYPPRLSVWITGFPLSIGRVPVGGKVCSVTSHWLLCPYFLYEHGHCFEWTN